MTWKVGQSDSLSLHYAKCHLEVDHIPVLDLIWFGLFWSASKIQLWEQTNKKTIAKNSCGRSQREKWYSAIHTLSINPWLDATFLVIPRGILLQTKITLTVIIINLLIWLHEEIDSWFRAVTCWSCFYIVSWTVWLTTSSSLVRS